MEKCSFTEARKKVGERVPAQQTTYAKVSASTPPNEPSQSNLDLILQKVEQSLNAMTQSLNIIMQALNVNTQTDAPTVASNLTPPAREREMLKSTSSSGWGVAQGSSASGGRRTTEANAPPVQISKSHKSIIPPTAQNTTVNSGSVAPAKKPTPAPKPKKQELVSLEISTKNKFEPLSGLNMEVESAPTTGGSGQFTTSPRKSRSPRKEDARKK